jgi:hypothetical protein
VGTRLTLGPHCQLYHRVVYYSVPDTRASIRFVETSFFTRRVVALELEDSLRQLQQQLMENPEGGALDPGTGGLRKVRIADPARGKGKRSGARVHYLWLPEASLVYMLSVYSKDELETLTTKQKQELRVVVEAIKREWKGRR